MPAVKSLLGILSAVLLAGCTVGAEPVALQLRQADLWVGRRSEPPPQRTGPQDPAWREVRLPDRWRRARRLEATEGWYRFRLQLSESPELLQGVFLPRAALNAQVFVNGVYVGAGGRFEPYLARNVFHPTYAPVPHRLLRAGENHIDVRLGLTLGSPAILEPIWVGPDRELRPSYERARFLSLSATRAAHVLAALVAVLSLFQALGPQRHGSGLGMLGGSILAVNGSAIGVLFPEVPLPPRLLEWLATTCMMLAVALLALALRRETGRRRPGLERTLLGGVGLVSLGLALVPYRDVLPMTYLAMLPALLLVGDAAVNAIRVLRIGSLGPVLPFAALAVFLVGLWVLDRFLPVRELHGFRLASLNMAGIAVWLAWFLLARTVRAMREADRLDGELAALQELQRSRQRLAVVERERAVARERERIMRDMHDGTAGQLVSALSLVRGSESDRAQLASLLQEALDDLRMTIEALDPGESSLAAILGILRAPIERRLRAHGLALEWRIGDVDRARELGSTDARNLLRLLQEAVANAIRHAQATRVEIEAGPSQCPDRVRVAVRDDGKGGAAPREGGRGLRNMEQRARELGGELGIASGPGGTEVVVELPVREQAPGGLGHPS